MVFFNLKQSKPRSVLFPIILFILFDCIALALNFWISFNLTENATAINLAGRQRMLSQRMTKTILQFDKNHPDLSEFKHSFDIFDKTLNSFWIGGETVGGDHTPIHIKAITTDSARTALSQGMQLWKKIKPQLLPLLDNPTKAHSKQIKRAKDSLNQHNIQLLKIMNDLTLSLEQKSAREAATLRHILTFILILALFNFFVVCRLLLTNIKFSEKNAHSLNLILNSVQTAIILHTEKGIIKSANTAATQLFNYEKNSLDNIPIDKLLHPNEADTLNNSDFIAVKHDGSTFKAFVSKQLLHVNNQSLTVCSVTDISQQKKKEKKLLKLAFHDTLTGLPNRLLLMERLKQELLHTKRNSSLAAILFLDLDGFKTVNDSFGHDLGDQLLQRVAERLQQCCREDDTVARLSGDEFVIILSPIQSVLSIKKIASSIIHKMNENFLIKQHCIHVGASIGISIYPEDHLEAEFLLKYADKAMYNSKQAGKNRYSLYSEHNNLTNSEL